MVNLLTSDPGPSLSVGTYLLDSDTEETGGLGGAREEEGGGVGWGEVGVADTADEGSDTRRVATATGGVAVERVASLCLFLSLPEWVWPGAGSQSRSGVLRASIISSCARPTDCWVPWGQGARVRSQSSEFRQHKERCEGLAV